MLKAIEFKVPEPCHENWQNMSPKEQGRFCLSCQKTVIDFSLMSDQEILNHISKSNTNVCGRFDKDQLNRAIRIDDGKKKFSFKYIWNLLLATTLVSAEAKAQQASRVQGKVKVIKKPNPTSAMVGMVVMDIPDKPIVVTIISATDNKPVAFATIKINEDFHTIVADSNGQVTVPAELQNDIKLIQVSSIGYKTKIINWENLITMVDADRIILLERKFIEPPLLSVNNSRLEESLSSIVLGGISVIENDATTSCNSIPVFQKLKDTISNIFIKNQISTFPNPVYAGKNMYIKFNVDDLGEYELQVINSIGQSIQKRSLFIEAKNQVQPMSIPAFFSKGIYFIAIQRRGSQKKYNAKFIVR